MDHTTEALQVVAPQSTTIVIHTPPDWGSYTKAEKQDRDDGHAQETQTISAPSGKECVRDNDIWRRIDRRLFRATSIIQPTSCSIPTVPQLNVFCGDAVCRRFF